MHREPSDDPAPRRSERVDPEDPRTDEALMKAYCGGDAGAFEAIVRRHRRALYGFLLRSVGHPHRAEELLQEVFVRVIAARDRYQASARLTTWMFTIARNLTVDESRRAKFRRHASLDAPTRGEGRPRLESTAHPQPGVDELAQAPTLARRIGAALDALPEEQREVFLLRQLGGLAFKEIAELLDTPENTVKSRMRYALDKLREQLADLDPEQAPPTAGRVGHA